MKWDCVCKFVSLTEILERNVLKTYFWTSDSQFSVSKMNRMSYQIPFQRFHTDSADSFGINSEPMVALETSLCAFVKLYLTDYMPFGQDRCTNYLRHYEKKTAQMLSLVFYCLPGCQFWIHSVSFVEWKRSDLLLNGKEDIIQNMISFPPCVLKTMYFHQFLMACLTLNRISVSQVANTLTLFTHSHLAWNLEFPSNFQQLKMFRLYNLICPRKKQGWKKLMLLTWSSSCSTGGNLFGAQNEHFPRTSGLKNHQPWVGNKSIFKITANKPFTLE